MSIKEDLDELIEFSGAKITRVKQFDCDLHIASYMIGDEPWVTVFEDYDGDRNFTRVNINGTGVVELMKILKEVTNAN